MTETAKQAGFDRRHQNGRLTYYHANSKGSGTAVRLELKMAANQKNGHGCFFLEMARQKTPPGRDGRSRTPATFDWESKATVKLSFTDVCELLTVLEDRQSAAGPRGRGLYHEAKTVNTIIGFRRNAERGGYNLNISRKNAEGATVFRGHILLSPAECVGLRSVFQAGLFHMAFHSSMRGSR